MSTTICSPGYTTRCCSTAIAGRAWHLHLRGPVHHQRDPRRIGVNMSSTLPMADGLSAILRPYLEEGIGSEYGGRLVSAELLASGFRATRPPEELAIYRRLCEWTVVWMQRATQPTCRLAEHDDLRRCSLRWTHEQGPGTGFGD